MLVSFYFHSSPIRGAIVQLLRDFMVEVVDLVRAWGYGAPTRPSYYDPEAVLVIVMKHDLQRHLAEAWDNGLTHPQKAAIDREVGLKASDRLTFALNHVPFIIDLGEQFATQLTVQGFAGLYNDVTGVFSPNPVVDFRSLTRRTSSSRTTCRCRSTSASCSTSCRTASQGIS